MMQVGAAIVRDAAEQNVVVTTLDNVDGVDLHVPQVLDRGLHGALAGAEGFALVETLSVEPDATSISPGDRNRTHLPLYISRFVRRWSAMPRVRSGSGKAKHGPMCRGASQLPQSRRSSIVVPLSDISEAE